MDKELCKDFIRSHGQKETVLQIQRASAEDVCKAHLERGVEGGGEKKPYKAQTASFLHCPWLRGEQHFRWINHREKQWDKSRLLLLRLSWAAEGLRCPFPTGAWGPLASGPAMDPARPWWATTSLHLVVTRTFGSWKPHGLFTRETRLRLCYQQVEDFTRLLLQKCLAGIKHANPLSHSGDNALPHAGEILLLAQAPMTWAFPLIFLTFKRTLASGKCSHAWARLGCAGWAGTGHVPPLRGDGEDVALSPPPHPCPGWYHGCPHPTATPI